MSRNKMDKEKHDLLVRAIVNVLCAYGFQVDYTVKGKKTEAIKVEGDSGLHYYPDVIARKGRTTLVGDIRTRGQRGTKDEIDRYVIQFLQAELDDWVSVLKRPHGMVVSLHGADKDATILADHFGIYIVPISLEAATEIAKLDVVSQKEKIIDLARKNNIVF